jgi:hypothetical protein
MGVILKENSIVYTGMKHQKFLGSSRWKFDEFKNCLVREVKQVQPVPSPTEFVEPSELVQQQVDEFLRVCRFQENERKLDVSLREKKTSYVLNKKKVREKCSSFFGLSKSRKFLAFFTISFPYGLDDDMIMKIFNTVLTRCRELMRLHSYLWVVERQKNGTLHFHLLTNDFIQVRTVNHYVAKAIETQLKKYDIDLSGLEYVNSKGETKVTQAFDVNKYNGVDVKLVGGNKKALNQYITKYISKNEIQFFRLPYHSSRDISQLFTCETFRSVDCSEFSPVAKILRHLVTYVVDSDFATCEYFCQKQANGKYFNPPDDWYWFRDYCNELMYKNVAERSDVVVIDLNWRDGKKNAYAGC